MQRTVTTTDATLRVYQCRDLASKVMVQAPQGTEMQLGPAIIHEGHEWVEATLEDGSVGYALGPSLRGHTTLTGPLDPPRENLHHAMAALPDPEDSPAAKSRRIEVLLISLLSMGLYALACYLPALRLTTGVESPRGIELLRIGWLGLTEKQFAWCANPILWLGWILLSRRGYKAAATVSGAAILVAMLTLQYYSQTLPLGGSNAHLEKPEIGFFCWIASMVVILLGSIRRALDASAWSSR